MTADLSNIDLWSGVAFQEAAQVWVEAVCEEVGLALTGAFEQPHCMPWSSAFSFQSNDGSLWFKVNAVGTRHEPALVGVLAQLVPDLMPTVLATDPERGWSLTRDAGPTLRSTAPPDQLWTDWEGIVGRYAEAQVQLAHDVPALLATGVPEVTPATLPTLFAELVDRLSKRDVALGGLADAQTRTLQDRLPAYEELCVELAESGVPSSIQHDDLHSSNICWAGSVESARVIDWGDASVGHPLGTMLCTLNSIAHHAMCEVEDPRVARVCDAYLEPFTRYASLSALRRCVTSARTTGCVTRALSWRSALLKQPVSISAGLEFPVRGWLLELLDT